MGGQGEVEELQAFVEDFGVGEFEQLADTTARIWRFFNVPAQPTYVFINDNGELQINTGALDADELTTRLQHLIDT